MTHGSVGGGLAFWGVLLIMCCKLGRSILLEEAMARVDAKLISFFQGPCWRAEGQLGAWSLLGGFV